MSEWQRSKMLGKRDDAEPEVVAVFTEAGATVVKHSGKDEADLFVSLFGRWWAVEVKTNKAKLTAGQEKLAEVAPVSVARNAAQARKLVREWMVFAAVDEARRRVGGGLWQAVEDAEKERIEREMRIKGDEPD